MRRFIAFTLVILTSMLVFATPNEYKYVSNTKNLLDKYVGSATYKYLVGGIYEKGDLSGAVMYVDEGRHIMKILCLNSSDIIDDARYDEIEEAYSKTPWHLFTFEDVNIITNNYGTMFYNKNWNLYQNEVFTKERLTLMYVKKVEDKPYQEVKSYEYFTIACGANGTRESKKWYEEVGGRIITHYRHFQHIGLCEVPFEPKYVHKYWLETH